MSLRQNPTSKSCRIRVGITIGDPSGIGPAVTLKAVSSLKGLADFVVIGDSYVLRRWFSLSRIPPSIKIVDLNNVNHNNFAFGKIRAEYGRASIEYLDKALELARDKEIDCLVTAPISKEAINLAGFHYSGHTEYLAQNTGTRDFVMMLLNKKLKFSLVTRHIPLKSVSSRLSKSEICKNIKITGNALKRLFFLRRPRIVVCGLNPHASDNGLIGDEENRIIKPAVEQARKKLKCEIDGPLPSDVAIYKAGINKYDCIIAMYHDQALIPLKLTGPDSGINLTLGLPFVRTSPLHGTAFDIAGSFRAANPASMIAAIKLAVKCTSNQKRD